MPFRYSDQRPQAGKRQRPRPLACVDHASCDLVDGLLGDVGRGELIDCGLELEQARAGNPKRLIRWSEDEELLPATLVRGAAEANPVPFGYARPEREERIDRVAGQAGFGVGHYEAAPIYEQDAHVEARCEAVDRALDVRRVGARLLQQRHRQRDRLGQAADA